MQKWGVGNTKKLNVNRLTEQKLKTQTEALCNQSWHNSGWNIHLVKHHSMNRRLGDGHANLCNRCLVLKSPWDTPEIKCNRLQEPSGRTNTIQFSEINRSLEANLKTVQAISTQWREPRDNRSRTKEWQDNVLVNVGGKKTPTEKRKSYVSEQPLSFCKHQKGFFTR